MAFLIQCHHCGGAFRVDPPPPDVCLAGIGLQDGYTCRRCGHDTSESPPPAGRLPNLLPRDALTPRPKEGRYLGWAISGVEEVDGVVTFLAMAPPVIHGVTINFVIGDPQDVAADGD